MALPGIIHLFAATCVLCQHYAGARYGGFLDDGEGDSVGSSPNESRGGLQLSDLGGESGPPVSLGVAAAPVGAVTLTVDELQLARGVGIDPRAQVWVLPACFVRSPTR